MEQENGNSVKINLVGQALLFGLLGKTLYAEPDQRWFEILIREDVFAEVPFGARQEEVEKGLVFLRQWAKTYSDGVTDAALEVINHDHLYLFIGVGRMLAAPYGSLYYDEKRLLFQESTLKVRDWYSRFGLQIERLHNEPDDHIGVELSFTAHLATLALQALENQDQARFEELITAQHDFLSENLFRWAPTWCDLVNQHARTDFYRGIALLVEGGLKETAEMLKQIYAELPSGDNPA